MLRLYVEIFHWRQAFTIQRVPISLSPLVAFAPAGNREMGTKYEERLALSALLVALPGPFGLVFHHGELDFLLHVVNAVNDHADFVADGVALL